MVVHEPFATKGGGPIYDVVTSFMMRTTPLTQATCNEPIECQSRLRVLSS